MRATPTIAELLEPYRGRRTLLQKELGRDAWGMLYAHPEVNGSPLAACEFLGYSRNTRGAITDHWTMLGLPVNRRDSTAHEKHVSGQLLETMTDEECLDLYCRETASVEYADVYEWKLPRGREYGICAMIGDMHLGSEECDLQRLIALRDYIASDPAHRWMGLGDTFNLNTKHSKGGLDSVSWTKARKCARALLKPIAGQCIGFVEGNHDLRPATETGVPVSVCKDLCQEIGIKHFYPSMSVFLRIRIVSGAKQQEYDGMIHHGFGGGQTAGTKRNYLHRMLANIDADFFFMGHIHDRLVDEKLLMSIGRETEVIDGREKAVVAPRECALGVAGSFQRWLPYSYARNKGMSPASLGSISAHFYTAKHTIHLRK